MGEPARKTEESLPDSDSRPVSEEEGVILTPGEEEALEQAIAEAEEDVRAGRFCTFDELRAKLRAA